MSSKGTRSRSATSKATKASSAGGTSGGRGNQATLASLPKGSSGSAHPTLDAARRASVEADGLSFEITAIRIKANGHAEADLRVTVEGPNDTFTCTVKFERAPNDFDAAGALADAFTGGGHLGGWDLPEDVLEDVYEDLVREGTYALRDEQITHGP